MEKSCTAVGRKVSNPISRKFRVH